VIVAEQAAKRIDRVAHPALVDFCFPNQPSLAIDLPSVNAK
jgi:hypothetical protein